MATQSPAIYKELDDSWKPVVKTIEDLPDTDPCEMSCCQNWIINGQLLSLMEKHYLSAVFYAKSSRIIFEKMSKTFPER